jgi:hypothetical protein
MNVVGTALKRESAVQGYRIFIKSATGVDPYVARSRNGAELTWKPGQARKMEGYLGKLIPFNYWYRKEKAADKKDPATGEPLNVNVAWGKVFLPLALKTIVPPLVIYTALIIYLTKRI